jgi:hypothetical protein
MITRSGSSFKAAAEAIFEDRNLSLSDREHLARWIADNSAGDDLVWDQIEAAAKRHRSSFSRAFAAVPMPYESLIRHALFARQVAETAKDGADPILRDTQQDHDDVLALADKARSLAEYYRKLQVWHVLGLGVPVPEWETRHWLLGCWEGELRERASRIFPQPFIDVSRQRFGKDKKRPRSREFRVFVQLMGTHLRAMTGKPYLKALASMTNIAFGATVQEQVDEKYVSAVLGGRSKNPTLDR